MASEGQRIAVDHRSLADAQLVAHALAGSQPAFEEIVRRYERPVHNLIWRIVRDPALAEDLAQDTFLKAFRALSSFDLERRLSSWLFRIAHNTALDAVRRRRGYAAITDPVERPPVPPPPDPLETAALSHALGSALDSLRPDFRSAIVLRYQEGCSYDEIAEIMGIPPGTAKTFVHRARKLMAGALEASGWRP